jgi:hypothetical protein
MARILGTSSGGHVVSSHVKREGEEENRQEMIMSDSLHNIFHNASTITQLIDFVMN